MGNFGARICGVIGWRTLGVVALFAAVIVVNGCLEAAPHPAAQKRMRLAPDTLPAGTERIEVPADFFTTSPRPPSGARAAIDAELTPLAEGFDLVAPLPLPTAENHRVHVTARLPAGARIDVVTNAVGAPTLKFPAGTWLARVEEVALKRGGFTVADVRGMRRNRDGTTTFYVLRPASPGPGAPLLGLGWHRDDVAAEKRAHLRLAEEMRATAADEIYGFVRAPAPPVLDKRVDHFVSIGRCAACHERARPDFVTAGDKGDRAGFFPRRATDANGFYSTASLFRTEQLRENYGAEFHDEGPHFRARCALSDPAACPPKAPRWVAFDLVTAHATGDEHAAAVCATQRTLLAAATDSARTALGASLPACSR